VVYRRGVGHGANVEEHADIDVPMLGLCQLAWNCDLANRRCEWSSAGLVIAARLRDAGDSAHSFPIKQVVVQSNGCM
jgi:hypothetical protein